MDDKNVVERIEMNPKVMLGKPVIKGTRIPAELVVCLTPRHTIPISQLVAQMQKIIAQNEHCRGVALQRLYPLHGRNNDSSSKLD